MSRQRNSEFALAAALALDGLPNVNSLAADTDGIDGSETNAGAFFDGSTIARMRQRRLGGRDLLATNDSFTAFEIIEDLLMTGPTGTNADDFRAIFIM